MYLKRLVSDFTIIFNVVCMGFASSFFGFSHFSKLQMWCPSVPSLLILALGLHCNSSGYVLTEG